MLYEDLTVKGAIAKALGKKPSTYGKPGSAYSKTPAASAKPTSGLPKQDNNLPMSRGFGPYSFGNEIPGTSRPPYTSDFETAKRSVGQEFERLARQYYRRQTEAFSAGRFEGNMIPELSTDIFAEENRSGEVKFGYSGIRAGIVETSGHGRSRFFYRRATVAVLHAHWVDTTCSSSRGFGRRDIDSAQFSDERAIREIRRQVGDHVRLFVYQWNGRWGSC